MRLFLIVFFSIWMASAHTHLLAQETFTANVSSNAVSIDEQFQVSFTLNTSGKAFQAPSFSDFIVLSGPNQSSSMQFVNGSMSQSISFTYYLQPKAGGTFKIGSATIQASGKTLKTNPITITVGKGGGAGGNKSGGSSGAEESLQSQLAKNIYIKAVANKTKAVRGEGIVVTYKLFTRVDLVDLGNLKMPVLEGFWSHDLEQVKELKMHEETIDGVRFGVAVLKKSILYPQRAGKLVVDRMESEAVVRVRTQRKARSNDPFADFMDDPFFGGGSQDIKHTIGSAPITIDVIPLPENAPSSFSGAVGKFTLQAFLDKTTTNANEPVTLKIKVTGNGNLKLIDPLKLQLPPDIETYEPKISDNNSASAEGISGARTFEYLLIPRRAGNYKINALDFSFFDLSKKQYITLHSNEFDLKVLKGNSTVASAGEPSSDKADLMLLGKDIKYIHAGNVELRPKDEFFFGSPLHYILGLAPLLGFLGFLFMNKKNESEALDVTGTKSKKATKMARAKLAGAAKLLKQNSYSKVYEEILRALWGYISDKYSIPASELNKENVRATLLAKNKSPEATEQFIGVIDLCEFARYSPAANMANAEEVYQKSILAITQIEQ